jgi:hypothetical protein
MAHRIFMFEPKHEVTNTDVAFSVKKNGKKIGELRVSKGSLEWYTGNGRTAYSISWDLFDEIMKKGGSIK